MADALRDQTIVIADGQPTGTTPIKLGHLDLVGLYFDAAFDGTAVSFKSGATAAACTSPVNFEGTVLSFAVAANAFLGLNPDRFAGCAFLNITSNANQAGGASTVRPVFRDRRG